ncbi:hypothetical protein [Labilithrix luteola]|nr:hypothetical protein [Labilithrix luteola]
MRAYLERHERGHLVMRFVFDDSAPLDHRRVHVIGADGVVRKFGYAPFSEPQRIALGRTEGVALRLLRTFDDGAWVRREQLGELIADCRAHESMNGVANVLDIANGLRDVRGICMWGPSVMNDPWIGYHWAVKVDDAVTRTGAPLFEPYLP